MTDYESKRMIFFGPVLIGLGACLGVYSLFFMSTSMPLNLPNGDNGILSGMPKEVYNLNLGQNQLLTMIAGSTLFLSGVIVSCANTLRPQVVS
jgi:hypothetical protein